MGWHKVKGSDSKWVEPVFPMPDKVLEAVPYAGETQAEEEDENETVPELT